jgi:hypothetical protein
MGSFGEVTLAGGAADAVGSESSTQHDRTAIRDVFATWMFVTGTRTFTFIVFTGNRDITAHISLSKLQGNSDARAFISQVCHQESPDQIICEVPDREGESVVSRSNVRTVMFALRVREASLMLRF